MDENISVKLHVCKHVIHICKQEIFNSQQKAPTNLPLLTNDCSIKIQGYQKEKEKLTPYFTAY